MIDLLPPAFKCNYYNGVAYTDDVYLRQCDGCGWFTYMEH